MLLVIATPQGRQIYDRAKAVEAQRGIKTLPWDAVEDNDYEIRQEHEDEEHDEDSLDLAFEKRSCSDVCICSALNKALSTALNTALSKYKSKVIGELCEDEPGCICNYQPITGNCAKCSKQQKS